MSDRELQKDRPGRGTDQRPALDRPAMLGLVAVKLVLHLLTIASYGYFRDELYFLDCGRHLDWGYVDCAPLVGVYAKIGLLLGGSLPAIRVLPTLAGVGLVALTIVLARELGGGSFAQRLAGLSVVVAPIFLASASFLSMNAFEPLFWTGCAFVLARIVRTGDSRLWLWFGVLAGLGLENKHSTLLFGFAVAVALLLSPERRELGRRWIWFGAGIALLLFLPNLLWQAANGLPTLIDLQNVHEAGKNVVLSPIDFMAQQAILIHPITLPIWLAGLVGLLVGRLARFRVLGWTYLVLLATMMMLEAKNYYVAPIYPMLLAAGGVTVEGWLADLRLTSGRQWAQVAVMAVVAVFGAVTAPMALPLLTPERFVAYQRALGFEPPKTEVAHVGPLPQLFGDRFGWPELVEQVADIYWSLPAEERAHTGIFASNYGEAGAINLLGPRYGLPPAICAHQSHSLWGPGESDPDILIWLQWSREALDEVCGSVEQAGEHFHPWGMAEENRPIYICRDPVMSIADAWPQLTHWN